VYLINKLLPKISFGNSNDAAEMNCLLQLKQRHLSVTRNCSLNERLGFQAPSFYRLGPVIGTASRHQQMVLLN